MHLFRFTSSFEFNVPNQKSLILQVDVERYQCSQLLFDPSIYSNSTHTVGLHEAIAKCIYACDRRLHEELVSRVIVAGGVSNMVGFHDTLHSQILSLGDMITFSSLNITILDSNEYPEYTAVYDYIDDMSEVHIIAPSEL